MIILAKAMLITCHLRISGRVQGVGFRFHMQKQARKLDVAGWVRNRHDGSVEAVAQRSREAVDRLIEWAQHGPPNARVTNVQVSDDSGSYTGFELRPTSNAQAAAP